MPTCVREDEIVLGHLWNLVYVEKNDVIDITFCVYSRYDVSIRNPMFLTRKKMWIKATMNLQC